MTYKLTYFDFAGLGEPIRYLLSYLDIDFEDNRIDYEKWPSIKHSESFQILNCIYIFFFINV